MSPGIALRRSPGELHPKGEKILGGFPPSPNPSNARALGPGGPDQRKPRLMIAVHRGMLGSMLQVGSVWGQSARRMPEARWVVRARASAAAVHSCSLGVASGLKKYKVISRSLLPADDSVDRLGCAAHGRAPPPHTFPTEEQRRRHPQRALLPSHPAPATPQLPTPSQTARRSLRRAVRRAPRTQHLMPLPYRSHACASGAENPLHRAILDTRPQQEPVGTTPHRLFHVRRTQRHTHLHSPTPVRLCKNSGWFARHHPTQPSTRTPPRLRHSAL